VDRGIGNILEKRKMDVKNAEFKKEKQVGFVAG
jgi:hypothetical protein